MRQLLKPSQSGAAIAVSPRHGERAITVMGKNEAAPSATMAELRPRLDGFGRTGRRVAVP